MHIRPHTLQDIDAIADILAGGWKAAYSGFMPEALLLPRIDTVYRRREIAEWLNDEFDPAMEHVLLAESEAVEGLVHIVLEDKAELGAQAHINLLYVRPDRFGQGIGRALMAAAAAWLEPRISGPVVLSAYADNPYHAFYAHIGGAEALRQRLDFSGHDLVSVYYRWDSASALKHGAARA